MKNILLLFLFATIFFACDKKKPTDDNNNNNNNNPYDTINNTLGFGLLNKIKGIWNGPVTSTTALGSYPEWIVDFRPISENQVSAKNELNNLNDINLSFFIAKYNNQYKVAFRNGGTFNGLQRISYFLADSVSETTALSYYRFSEVKKGKSRAYTEVVFKADSLIIESFTNKNNTQATAIKHMSWRAKLQDTTSCQPSTAAFGFPKKTLTKNFSETFNNDEEAVYYSLTSDPYPESVQPYLGKATISYTFSSGFVPDANKNIFIIMTTQPLINGFNFNTQNLKYRSRYVVLKANENSFVFNYMHPGSYYLYALYDNDGNNNFSSGDRISASNTIFSLADKQSISAATQINFVIP